jgi:hypothetical protein
MAMMISTNATTAAEPVLKSGAGRAQESPEEELTPGRRLRPYSHLRRPGRHFSERESLFHRLAAWREAERALLDSPVQLRLSSQEGFARGSSARRRGFVLVPEARTPGRRYRPVFVGVDCHAGGELARRPRRGGRMPAFRRVSPAPRRGLRNGGIAGLAGPVPSSLVRAPWAVATRRDIPRGNARS